MFRDRSFAVALLLLVVLAFVEYAVPISLTTAPIVVMALFGPFAVIGLFLTRGALQTQSGWDRPGAPNEVTADERDR